MLDSGSGSLSARLFKLGAGAYSGFNEVTHRVLAYNVSKRVVERMALGHSLQEASDYVRTNPTFLALLSSLTGELFDFFSPGAERPYTPERLEEHYRVPGESFYIVRPDASQSDTFRDCNDCPLMVNVPAGSYTMGSPESEWGRGADEGPQHVVTIDEPFAVGVYEVTFEEWDACVAAGGCDGYRPNDWAWGRGRRPVITVGWRDAQRYVAWLSSHTGAEYRLLSESEWEYVARAGTTTAYHFGTSPSKSLARYRQSGAPVDRTVEVGSYAPNAFGLYDVHGNVWEWTQDCWNGDYTGAPADGSAWEQGNCSRRVMRGGSWAETRRDIRSANRAWGLQDNTRVLIGIDNSVGFRVARNM